MKNTKKKVLTSLAVSMLTLMMVFSVTQSKNGLNFSIVGYEAMAQGFSLYTCHEFGVHRGHNCLGFSACLEGIDELVSAGCTLTCYDDTIIICPSDDE